MYDPQHATTLPESGQTLAITINEVDLDEEDIEPLPIMEDTVISVPVSIQPEAELPPPRWPLTPQISPEPPTAGEIRVEVPIDKPPALPRPPSPVSLHQASPPPQTNVPNLETPRKRELLQS
jgi:hypothetical protein